MKRKLNLKSISKMSDSELLRRVSELLQNSRCVEAELIAHMVEVDERRLYRKTSSSMFSYCTEILHLAEHEAFLRIKVARASREHPVLLEMLADGRLHLSAIVVLRPHLTETNRKVLLSRAVHKTRRQVEELVAELVPKPAVPPTIRKLPERREKTQTTKSDEQVPEPVPAQSSEPARETPDTDEKATAPPTPATNRPAAVAPLSAETYKVTFTASAELRDKLERLRALMRSTGDADLVAVIEAAVTEKLERLESKRYGTTKTPRKDLEGTDTSPSSRHIPAAVKRAVYERDGARCTCQDDTGRRCTETKQLEFHHVKPYGHGGDHRPGNIQLRCRTHNLFEAERDYGKMVMDRYRNSSGRVSEAVAVYTFSNRTTQTARTISRSF